MVGGAALGMGVVVVCGCGIVVRGLPHFAQNLAHSAFNVPHFWQVVDVDNR